MTDRIVAGRYRLGSRIGVGGMGRVWHAYDEVLRREVAVKEVMLPETPSENEAHELSMRTLREAQAAARLSHPNVVRVYDVMYADDRPWIVMEYIPSRSLAQVIKTEGPLRPEQVARVGIAVLDALCAAHAAGVLHRDIKPGNVLLAEDGRVVLTDFGLATFEEIGIALTQSGIVHGSPQFIAPERALDGTSSVEADMWSLGATLYAAVEGQSPYARPTSYQTLAALATSPPDPPKQAGALKPVLAGLLRRKPSSRLKAADVRLRLQRVASGDVGRRFPMPRRPAADDPSGVGTALPAATADRAASGGTDAAAGANPPIEWRSADGGIVTAPPASSQPASTRPGSTQPPSTQPPSTQPPSAQPASIGSDSTGSHAGSTGTSRPNSTPPPRTSGSRTTPAGPREDSDTKEELSAPPRRARWRLAAVVSAVVIVLAGGGYVAQRQLRTSHETSPPASTTSDRSTTPGAVATPSTAAPSGVPVLANVGFPCDESPPANPVAVPPLKATYNGLATVPNWTWFDFTPDFPVALPVGWSIARSAITACLYDQTGRPARIAMHESQPQGEAAIDASAAMRLYQHMIETLSGFHVVDPVTASMRVAPGMTSSTITYTYNSAVGPLYTWARIYLTRGDAYLMSFTTLASSVDSDQVVWGSLTGSVVAAHVASAGG